MKLKIKNLNIILLAMILLTAFTLTGCNDNSGNNSNTTASENEAQLGTITLSVEGYDNTANYPETEIEIVEEMTALDALIEAIPNISITDGFVTAIDGLSNGSVEGYPYCGWVYYVNGEFSETGASEYIVQDGDNIEWKFSLSFD